VRILAVDTTSALGSVALVDGSVVQGEVRLAEADTPSVRLLPAIERLLEDLDLDSFQVDAYAAAVGPGSFTGLRVGLSTVQGLALAAGRPCLGVCILDVLASVSVGDPTMALRGAFHGEVYWSLYDEQGRTLEAPRVGPLAEALGAASPETSFVGDAATQHREAIADQFPGARFPSFEPYLSATLGLWAEPRLRAGQGARPESLRPLYVRGADIRRGRA
jgi:tRNA threonylcarbamoyladenosine biosynthesis protein TsaB